MNQKLSERNYSRKGEFLNSGPGLTPVQDNFSPTN